MKTVIDAVEDWLVHRGWNVVRCDICGTDTICTRTHDIKQIREEAEARGWQVADKGRTMDLCPNCKEKA